MIFFCSSLASFFLKKNVSVFYFVHLLAEEEKSHRWVRSFVRDCLFVYFCYISTFVHMLRLRTHTVSCNNNNNIAIPKWRGNLKMAKRHFTKENLLLLLSRNKEISKRENSNSWLLLLDMVMLYTVQKQRRISRELNITVTVYMQRDKTTRPSVPFFVQKDSTE